MLKIISIEHDYVPKSNFKNTTIAIIVFGLVIGLSLGMLVSWGITEALNTTMGQHNADMKWEHDWGTVLCVEVATLAHMINIAIETGKVLQENNYQLLAIPGQVQHFTETLKEHTRESFLLGDSAYNSLKRYGPTLASMTGAGLTSTYLMDHTPEMSALHVVLVGTTVKSLDFLLGALAKHVSLIHQAHQAQDIGSENV